jgi:prephenate dehydratase/prephenate dehydrogenase
MILRRRKRRAVGLWNAIFLLSSLMAGTHAAPNSKLTSLFSDRGGSSTVNSMSSNTPMRVAYQGEPGAYSEKATRELLGSKVTAIGRPSFEDCFRAVASMECDYACLPIENSLGGSIHENYDLMLRYDLTIVGEHEFRVHHCLLAKPGVKREDIKYAISHPQALAQCDNFLRGLDITPIPTYDTAGSAKMISEGTKLPGKCTPENTAAIASDLAGTTYGLNCLDKGIEDDDTNFTRFLLLARKGVVEFLNKQIPSKTSVVFTLHNTAGALYKALACFSLRDIDCSKIESRPTSASLLNFLKFRSQQQGRKSRNKADLPRFRYCFYLDFLASELDENTQNALSHLREQADFIRILGSYPTKSRLVGPVKAAAEETANMVIDPKDFSLATLPSDLAGTKPLNIGIVGFGTFGQFLSKRMSQKHRIACIDKVDKSKDAQTLGVEYYPLFDMGEFLEKSDIIIVAVPMIDFEDVILTLPADRLRGKLVVEVCPLSAHPKSVLLRHFGPEVDILSTHPMFGPTSKEDPYSSPSWDGRPLVYEKVRIMDARRCDDFLSIFEDARCQLVEMTAEQHDASTADAEFVTHLTGRLLDRQLLPATPVSSKEYAALCDVADMTSGDSFDLFFGMFKFNDRAKEHLNKMRDNLARVERQLAAKEAYIEAREEMKATDRQRLISETKSLLQDIIQSGELNSSLVKPAASTPPADPQESSKGSKNP